MTKNQLVGGMNMSKMEKIRHVIATTDRRFVKLGWSPILLEIGYLVKNLANTGGCGE